MPPAELLRNMATAHRHGGRRRNYEPWHHSSIHPIMQQAPQAGSPRRLSAFVIQVSSLPPSPPRQQPEAPEGQEGHGRRLGDDVLERHGVQEELLFLPRVTVGKPTIHEKMLRRITTEIDWEKQREMWCDLTEA